MATTSIANLKQRTAPQGGTFDADAWHAMQARDDQLIRDSVLHGYTGKEYVYKFKIGSTEVTGVSVVGARELASHYGGIKSRIVASVDKTGSLFVFKSFEPLAIQAQMIPQLADEDDFYEVVVEITDIKTGNSIQVRKKETKQEKRRDGSKYERPHFDVIAESKAFRNGVLSIIPQNVIAEFERRALSAGNSSNEKTIDELRASAIAHAAKHKIAIDRQAVGDLTYAEIRGLGSAASEGIEAFRAAAEALGILRTAADRADPVTGELTDQRAQQSDMTVDYGTLLAQIQKAGDVDTLAMVMDSARDLPANELAKLTQAFEDRREVLLGA